MLQGTDFIYEIVFQNDGPKDANTANFGRKFRNFIFAPNLTVRQIWVRWFQIWQWYFQLSAQKYPNKAILVQDLRIFIFAQNFILENLESVDFK